MLNRLVRASDLWVGLAMLAIAGVTLYGASQMFIPRMMTDALGPRTLPGILGTMLAVLALVVWIRAAVRGSDKVDLGRLRDLGTLLGSLLVYLLLFERVGYVVSTVLFLAVLFFYLGERRHWLTAIVSIGVAALFYVVFADLLSVNLPVGPFGF